MQQIPFDNIIQVGQQTMLESNLFNISWILGRFCNYKCSYCWPYARTDKLDFLPFEIYTNGIDSIKQQAQSRGFNKFHWSFSGGEPTAYANLLHLIERLKDTQLSYQSIHMTTNLSPGSKWWGAWLKITRDMSRRSLTASYHAEFAKEQEFGDKILMLTAHGVYVTVNQVMVPDKFNELYARLERFNQRGINVTLKPQSNESANQIVNGYTDDQITLMQTGFPQKVCEVDIQQIKLSDGTNDYYIDQAERFNSFGFNQFQGWACNSGYQSVIIRGNEVKRGYSCQDQMLGSLTEGFKLFDSPQVCITPTCVSSADSKIPKWK